MKSELILVTGGARSGKSRIAESLLDGCGRKFYIATCPVFDAEMADRVRRHQADRAGRSWTTIEEEVDLAAAFRAAADGGADGVLVDCLTLWINNLLYRDENYGEDEMIRTMDGLLPVFAAVAGRVVLVINEVGLGLVPDQPLGRRFRDLSGRCAQAAAARADQVYFCVAGIAQRIK